jgi:catechol-2,3-dioxygenase
LDAGVDIGHVHLKVSDLDRSVAFYPTSSAALAVTHEQ